MKKKASWIAALAALAMNAALWGASITVTSPGSSSEWCRGGAKTYIIRWTKSGAMQATAAIRLRRAGSPESEPAALAIADGTANSGSFLWSIPDTVAEGQYFIRVRTDDSTVSGDSPTFRIKACPGTITVTAPAAGANWQRGSTKMITWTKFGAMQATAAIRLRRAGSPESEAAVLSIADGTANDGSHSWPIPDTVPEGQYFIRVRTDDSTVIGDSRVFNITKFLVVESVVPLSTLDQYDLAFSGDGLEFIPQAGQPSSLIANVKNLGTVLIDRDVNFSLVFPEMTRDGAQTVTKHLYIPSGQERGILVTKIGDNQIPLDKGLQVRVTIDGPISQIPETNEDNNTREIRAAKLDLVCKAPRSSLQLSKLYMQGGDDFRVRFKIKVSHNLLIILRNVHVHWTLSGPDGGIMDYNHIIPEMFPGGGEYVWEVDEKYGKEGRSNAHFPKLREGVTYRVTAGITDPGDDFYDVNPSNDSESFTFSFPD